MAGAFENLMPLAHWRLDRFEPLGGKLHRRVQIPRTRDQQHRHRHHRHLDRQVAGAILRPHRPAAPVRAIQPTPNRLLKKGTEFGLARKLFLPFI